ncbi:MAG: hypothetical protein ACXAEU_25640 [Candidatus Hodarchaeales archaeon]
MVIPEDRFCSYCGAKIKRNKIKTRKTTDRRRYSDSKAIKKSNSVSEITREKRATTCKNCGTQLRLSSMNCSRCGVRREKCPVCLKFISKSDDIGACPTCNSEFHLFHLKGTIKITGKCPSCRSPLKEREIRVLH